MAEILKIDNNLSDEEKYFLLSRQITSLINREDNFISNLANVTAALKQTFAKISWVGFYLYDGEKLYLGPFQGKVACTKIEIGKGVCGKVAELKETLIVPDVYKFPGHIFCDPDSMSEIVVPLIKSNKLIGVLDIDSAHLNSFNEKDKIYLEQICNFITEEIFT